MKTLIIYYSVHHENTKKIAEVIADELNADIFNVSEVNNIDFSDYDLIGLGSGVYMGSFHNSIMNLIDKIKDIKNKRFFIFSTSGIQNGPFNELNKKIRDCIVAKEGRIIATFNCRGYSNWGPLKLIGGMNKGHPNDNDINAVREFAKNLKPKPLTLCLASDSGRILLGMKKRGFGEGRWNGFGGKVEKGESIVDAARREFFEESMLTANDLEEIGKIYFDFIDTNNYFEVHVFDVVRYIGEPKETEEMEPRWFYFDEIPFENMWPDDIYWLPLFLQKRKFSGKFLFEDNNKLISHNINLNI